MRCFSVLSCLLSALGVVASAKHGGKLVAPGPNIAKYAVKSLPQVDPKDLPVSWAGVIPIGRGYGNDSVFFWLWQSEVPKAQKDLIIWFQGGPGCSSSLGLFKENGPLLFPKSATRPVRNAYSWTRLANVLYVDQPIGTGFSYGNAGSSTPAGNTAAFVQWLAAFLEEFPVLKSSKIHLMGESFAGITLPYIAEAIQNRKRTLGFGLTSVSLGNAAWANGAALTAVGATTFVKQHKNDYGIQAPADVIAVLEKADKDCGFTSILSSVTYPPKGKIYISGNPGNSNYKRTDAPAGYVPEYCDFENGTTTATQVSFLINGTDCYGSCATFDAAYNFFLGDPSRCFNAYNVGTRKNSGTCLGELYDDRAYAAYLNLPAVKSAIHVPSFIIWKGCNGTIQQDLTSPSQRSVPPAYSIIPALIAGGVEVNIFAGGLDYVLPAIGNEIAIQNMTWSGKQGFQKKPSASIFVDGKSVGVWGAERGLSYWRFDNAGHRVPQDAPAAAFQMVKRQIVKW